MSKLKVDNFYQFLSIYYLNKLDHFIVHDLHLKYYCGYMDDFIIFSPDLEYLRKCKDVIIEKLENEYKKVVDKTVIRIKRSNIEKIKKRVKEVRYLYDNNKISTYSAFCSVMTYTNSYKYSDNYKILKSIDKYWYHEK